MAQDDTKIGVILANLGTPDGHDYWSMRRYLSEFLSDKRVINVPAWKWQPILQAVILTLRPSKSGAAYREIWNHEADESPLLTITREQTDLVRDRLKAQFADRVEVDFAMRYGNPSIKSVLSKMIENGCNRVAFFPLYPQFSGPSTATANDHFFRALMTEVQQPATRTIAPYYDNPGYIEALAQSILRGLGDTKPDVVLASYHGMPKSYIDAGDPYVQHCEITTDLLRTRLGWDDDRLISTYQSRFGLAEWIPPYTIEEIARLAQAGKRNIAVLAPGFSADCLETLEEINGEIKDAFIGAGGETFTYIPCLNSDDAHIKMLSDVITENLAGWAD